MDTSEKEIKKLKKEVKEANVKLERMTSFRYNFLLSIVKGVGTVIGATIVVTLLYALLSWIIQSLGGIPFLENILRNVR